MPVSKLKVCVMSLRALGHQLHKQSPVLLTFAMACLVVGFAAIDLVASRA